jgi:hypothetical protein
MIQGARDNVVPTGDSLKLWRALGKPPLQWADVSHIGLGLSEMWEYDSGYAYFLSNWAPAGTPDPPLPSVTGITLKPGFILFSGSHPLLSLQDQIVALGHKQNHTSLFSFNLGVTTSRPFAALGYTVSNYIDAGIAMRVSDHSPEAYVGVYFPL